MKIAALQMVSTPDVARNVDTARRLIADAARQGAQLVALPEYFCLMGRRDEDKLGIAEAPGRMAEAPGPERPLQHMLSQAAKAHGLWVVGGTLPLKGDAPNRVRNSVCVYGPEGTLAARYDKVHIFRFDNGRESYDEARVLEAGNASVTLQTGALKLGLSVCYDLRFPELYRAMSPTEAPCDLIAVPAAFTHTTGRAHWELLLRARAVENQCYIIAAAQGGEHENGRRTWGHSMIIDPWGDVLAVLPEGEGVVIADVQCDRLARVREQLPALQHRRL